MRLIDAELLAEDIELYCRPTDQECITDPQRAIAFNDGINCVLWCIEDATTIAPTPNNPLTVDELREMDGEIWVCYPQETYDRLAEGAIDCTRYTFSLANYGKTWIAYRCKPYAKEDV